MSNLFFLQLLVTKKCNQNCSYCGIPGTSIYKDINPEVDIDFLKYVIDCHDSYLMIEICGGEPGLISNIDEVFKTIYNSEKVKRIQVMSNGLIRKRGVDWLNKVDRYCEHLILDIVGKEMIKHYSDLEFDYQKNFIYVIVTSEITTRSILENWKFWKEHDICKSPNFWFKIMADKVNSIYDFKEELFDLFKKISPVYDISFEKETIIDMINNEERIFERKLCAKNPPNILVDFETKELAHCGCFPTVCKRFPFNKEVVKSNMKCELFELEDCCKTCYVFDRSKDKVRCLIDSLKGIYRNRSYI